MTYVTIASMYAIFTYIQLFFDSKCRQIYHTWMLWVLDVDFFDLAAHVDRGYRVARLPHHFSYEGLVHPISLSTCAAKLKQMG